MRFEDQRKRLVQELIQYGIKDQLVLNAFESIPREKFVLPEYAEYAYRNQPLPIEMNQTISQPLMIAIMLEHLELNSEDVVLDVGTGSGYQTALLASIVKEVCTIERLDNLSLKARNTLKSLGYENIYYRIGDGSQGWQKAFPTYTEFSKIIVSAAASQVPDKLVSQLSDPGILVIPVGAQHYQSLLKITKSDGKVVHSNHGGCTFVPLIINGQ
ncbi:MAG: protein-L-isoaspartate(D-aspartate) O-methyltransferase [Candidatus Cloacimonadaceae bacterium]